MMQRTDTSGDLWDRIKEYATLSMHPRGGVMMARIVWRGEPLTSVGGTSNQALRALYDQVQQIERAHADA